MEVWWRVNSEFLSKHPNKGWSVSDKSGQDQSHKFVNNTLQRESLKAKHHTLKSSVVEENWRELRTKPQGCLCDGRTVKSPHHWNRNRQEKKVPSQTRRVLLRCTHDNQMQCISLNLGQFEDIWKWTLEQKKLLCEIHWAYNWIIAIEESILIIRTPVEMLMVKMHDVHNLFWHGLRKVHVCNTYQKIKEM